MVKLERAAFAALMLMIATLSRAAPDAPPLPSPFVSTYSVAWRGITAGTSTLELKQTGPDEFVYSSRNTARGIFKLAFPDAITQVSKFKVVNGEVVPLSYQADDGSSDKSKSVSLEFDWNAKRVRGTSEGKPVDLPLQPGTQDALSVQIALMLDLKAGHPPSSFWLISKDEVQEYRYSQDGRETLVTPLGSLDTVIYRSHHEGSSRTTRLWLAPSLDYLPVRAEQTRDGKTEFSMNIRSHERK
jgi:hypothetical protein